MKIQTPGAYFRVKRQQTKHEIVKNLLLFILIPLSSLQLRGQANRFETPIPTDMNVQFYDPTPMYREYLSLICEQRLKEALQTVKNEVFPMILEIRSMNIEEENGYFFFTPSSSSWIRKVEYVGARSEGYAEGFIILHTDDGVYLYGMPGNVLPGVGGISYNMYKRWENSSSAGDYFHRYINKTRFNIAYGLLNPACK